MKLKTSILTHPSGIEIETPLFVSSELTSFIQLTDVCVFALRRYLEKSETTLRFRGHPVYDQIT